MKVEIRNLVTNREYKAEFETEAKLDAWVQMQLDKGMKCPWGKPEHEVIKRENVAPNDRAVFVEEVILQEEVRGDLHLPTLDENGNVVIDEDGNTVTQIIADQILQEEERGYKFRIPVEYEIYKDVAPIDKSPIYFQELRDARSLVLRDTDWSQLADAPLSTDERNYYREYRQYLRDLPLNYDDQSIINWSIMSYSDFLVFKGYNL